MNKQQHIFIWIGIALLVFMAIVFESNVLWVISSIALIGELVFICKGNKLYAWHWVLLFLAIVVFIIVFLFSLPESNKWSPLHKSPRYNLGSPFAS